MQDFNGSPCEMDFSNPAFALLQRLCSDVRGCGSLPYFFCCCTREDRDEFERLVSLKRNCTTSDRHEEIDAQFDQLAHDPAQFEFSVCGYNESALILEKFDVQHVGDTSFLLLPALTEFLRGRHIVERNDRLYLEIPPNHDEVLSILQEAGGPFLSEDYALGGHGSDGKPDTAAS